MNDPVIFSAQWWTTPLGSWMAWTWPTVLFFLFIALCLIVMIIWEYLSPGGNPRRGLFRMVTTRGDRLFISLLGSAFMCMAWLFFFNAALWWALFLCAGWTILIFLYV